MGDQLKRMIALATTALLAVGLTAGTGIPAMAQPATDSGTDAGTSAPDIDWLAALGAESGSAGATAGTLQTAELGTPVADAEAADLAASLASSVCTDGVNVTTIRFSNANPFPVGAFELRYGQHGMQTVTDVPANGITEVQLNLPEDETTRITVQHPDGQSGDVTLLEVDLPVDCVDTGVTPAPTPVDVSTLAVEFLDRCGTANDETVLPEAEGVSLTLLPVLDGITRVEVRAADGFVLVDADGAQIGDTTTFGHAFTDLPCELTATPVPTAGGNGVVGQTLTVTPGDWEPAPVTLSYQWYRGTSPIAGATRSSYTLVAADAGAAVSVRVTGSKTGYTTVSKFSAAKRIATLPLKATPTPKIAGTGAVGKTLTAIAGTWSPSGVSLKYRWYRDGAAIPGATAKTYKLVAADAGRSITVTVTGSKTSYTSVSKRSAGKTVAKLLKTTTPKITGTGKVGKTLTAVRGTWGPGSVSIKYQWYRNGAAVSGATKSTYTLTARDAGTSITVKVAGSKSGYTSVNKVSAPRSVATVKNPGDTKNCGDFASHNAAQKWFDHYYPLYGDIARLDRDNDRVACE